MAGRVVAICYAAETIFSRAVLYYFSIGELMGKRTAILILAIIAILLTIAGFYFFTAAAGESLTYDPAFQAEVTQLFSDESIQESIKSHSCPKELVSRKEKELCELSIRQHAIQVQINEAFRRRGPFSLPLSKLTKQEANAIKELIRIRIEMERVHSGSLPDWDVGPNPIVDFDISNTHTDGLGIRGKMMFAF